MIFKVSFKETTKKPSKAIAKYGGLTRITIKGVVKLPAFWHHIPEDIEEWIKSQVRVELYEDVAKNLLYVFSEGKSRCMEGDRYDSLLGERLAEARAKYNIYKFFYDLTCRLYDYYEKILFGNAGIVDSGDGSCLAEDMRKYEKLYKRELNHQRELINNKYNG